MLESLSLFVSSSYFLNFLLIMNENELTEIESSFNKRLSFQSGRRFLLHFSGVRSLKRILLLRVIEESEHPSTFGFFPPKSIIYPWSVTNTHLLFWHQVINPTTHRRHKSPTCFFCYCRGWRKWWLDRSLMVYITN